MKKILLLVLFISLLGCSSKPVVEPEPITVNRFIILDPPKPVGVTLEIPTFYVVTATTCQKVSEDNGPLFSLDSLGYQKMARNIQEMRRYILELQNVIKYYKEVVANTQNETQTSR